MKKAFVTSLLALLLTGAVRAAEPLRFGTDGKFKIVQFTDIHFKPGDGRSDTALVRIDEVMRAERPDLVLLTGDIIYAKPAEKALPLSCYQHATNQTFFDHFMRIFLKICK